MKPVPSRLSLTMSASTSGDAYAVLNYATRISTDGIYLHRLDATVWAQGSTDTGHRCLNLNGDNAKWFYDFSMPSDVVEVRNSRGPPLTLGYNGDWIISWDQWRQGSAQR